MNDKENISIVKDFLNSQKVLTISTIDPDKNPWICNVYFGNDDNLSVYFLSNENANHSVHIESNNRVAFSSVWHDPENLELRRSVQCRGECHLVKNPKEILDGIKALHNKFLDWREYASFKNLSEKLIESRLYKISPTYIKYWDDQHLGDEKTVEFKF